MSRHFLIVAAALALLAGTGTVRADNPPGKKGASELPGTREQAVFFTPQRLPMCIIACI